MAGPASVTVVVAAYDEERHVARCLASLRHQTHRPLEVVVVDDGSTDATVAEVGTFVGSDRDVPVRLLRQDHRGAAVARNLAAAAATGDILVFLDADMEMPPPFVERLIAPMVEQGAVGTFTREILVANGDRRWARAHMLGRNLPAHTHFVPGFPDEWENFRAVRRADFERVGGFDDVGHGEDVTLGRKLGALAVAAPGTECWHHEPDTLPDIFRSARWLGGGVRMSEHAVGQYLPWRALTHGLRQARRHHMPSLVLYQLWWSTGVLVGWLGRSRPAARMK